MIKLSIQDNEGRSTVIPLADGDLSIGRDEANSICLTDRNVSRQHARLTTKNSHVWIENVSATYGTRINNLLLRAKSELKPGDVVQVGDYVIELVSDEAKRDTAMVDPVAADAASQKTPASQQVTRGKSSGSDTAIVDLGQIAGLLDDKPGTASAIPEAAQPRLVVESENLRGLELRITKTPIVVGRTRDTADLVIDHKSISKEHARLTRQTDGTWQVLDLGSANGIKVNGEPFAKCALQSGDKLELGHVALRFLMPGAKAPAVGGGEGKGKAGKTGLIAAVAIVAVVVVVGAIAAFVLSKGDKAPPKDDKPAQPDKVEDKSEGKAEPGGDEAKAEPGAKPAVDVADVIKGADALRSSGNLADALALLKGAQEKNPGNAKLELAIRKVENEIERKQKIEELEPMIETDAKQALDKLTELKADLPSDSSLRAAVDSLIEAAKAKTAPVKVAAAPKPAASKPAAVAKPPEPKPAEVKPVPEPAAPAAAKSGADLYKEGRDKMVAGDTDGALASFKSAAGAGYGKAHGQLARIYFTKGDKGNCAKHAKTYIDKYPDAGDAQAMQSMLEKCQN
jgi:pSer/pThr/pTyr-binding forkhead associated (FHA) protein